MTRLLAIARRLKTDSRITEIVFLTTSQALSIMIQIDGYTSPLKNTGVPELDNASMQLGLGFQYGFGKNTRMTFALGEDLAGRCGPDFTMHLSLEYTVGPVW